MTRAAENGGRGAAEAGPPEFALLDRAAVLFRRRWVCVAAMLVVALTLALNVIPHWNPTPDSALYLSLARSLARGEGYQTDGIPHTLVLPGYPLLLSAVFRAAGENFLLINLVQAAFGMGCVLLTAAVLRRWLGTPAAVMLAALAGMTESLVRWSARVLTDVPHLFFCLAALLLIHEMSRRPRGASRLTLALLVGPVTLAAAMLRLNGLLLLPVAAAALLGGRENRLTPTEKGIALAAWTAVIAVPFILWCRYVASVPPEMRNTYLAYAGLDAGVAAFLRHTLATLATMPQQIVETLLRNDFSLLPDLLLTAVVAVGLARLARRGAWALTAFTVLQVGLFSTQEFQRRYLVVVLPFLAAGFVVGVAYAVLLGGRRRAAGRRPLVGVALVMLVMLVLNVVPIVKWTLEAHGSPFYETYRGGRWHAEMVLSAWMREHTAREEVFWTERPTELSFLSGRRVVGPGTPCRERAVGRLPAAETLARNIARWKPRYVILDDLERAYSARVLEAVGEAWPGFRRVEVPGLKRLTLLELTAPASTPSP